MPPAETWMDLEIVIQSEVSQIEKDIGYHLYVESKKKMVQMNLFTKQKQSHKCRKTNIVIEVERRKRDKLADWD